MNPLDDKEALRLTCPKCGDVDWFEWRFLGKLKDPVCGYEWYAGTGLYAAKQLRASFQFGKRVVKYMQHGITGQGAWITHVMSWMLFPIGVGCRLMYAVGMIPIQALVRLLARDRSGSGSSADSEQSRSASAGR